MMRGSQFADLLEQVERLRSIALDQEARIRGLEAQMKRTNERMLQMLAALKAGAP